MFSVQADPDKQYYALIHGPAENLSGSFGLVVNHEDDHGSCPHNEEDLPDSTVWRDRDDDDDDDTAPSLDPLPSNDTYAYFAIGLASVVILLLLCLFCQKTVMSTANKGNRGYAAAESQECDENDETFSGDGELELT